MDIAVKDMNNLSHAIKELHKEAMKLEETTRYPCTSLWGIKLDEIKEATYELEKATAQINQLRSYICYIMQIPISQNDQ